MTLDSGGSPNRTSWVHLERISLRCGQAQENPIGIRPGKYTSLLVNVNNFQISFLMVFIKIFDSRTNVKNRIHIANKFEIRY